MDIQQKLNLLGGLTPEQFMRRHWQKKPLLIRRAFDPADPRLALAPEALFAMAQQGGVQSRRVQLKPGKSGSKWDLAEGPFAPGSLPPLTQAGWTLLVQGVDLLHPPVHDLLQAFRFVPDARLDDVMVSYATDGGGVGPHFDSYDVFLLQASGQRLWDISAQKNLALLEDLPLKILREFSAEQSFVLEPGDMLYLPPRYAHHGLAVGDCMTYSVGYRAPSRKELAQELLARLADQAFDDEPVAAAMYRDTTQPAVTQPAAIPPALQDFAQAALQRFLQDPRNTQRALGEYLTEPKPQVWFDAAEPGAGAARPASLVLDRRTRMMYDDQHIYINGEAFRASGRDATLIRSLADERGLPAAQRARLSSGAAELLLVWLEAGWLHERA
ncbi:MAG: JmjC domain-containing protein [Burkholderiaceae bacterium]